MRYRSRIRTRKRRALDYLLAALLLSGVAVLTAFFASLNARELSGTAIAVDGDSLLLNGQRLRLEGIDAPEMNQVCRIGDGSSNCGREARQYLRRLIGSSPVRCEGWQQDKYDRLLVRCFANGKELNRVMVRDGWAVSFGGFEEEELAARRAKRGLWEGDFLRPDEWRAQREAHGGVHELPHDFSVSAFVANGVSRMIEYATEFGN